jgi:REP element-mobilizing transposase RayT
MPRRLPPIEPQAIYHVGSRGSFGEPLFRTVGEHELFLELYEKYSTKFGWRTLAWCLLFNHYHFLVELTKGGLSEGMQRINHGFSRRINTVYKRTGKGHLVRHGFDARIVETEEYFLEVNAYIDLNPVEAERCEAPEEWEWSGCAATLGLATPRPFHDLGAQLAHFGSSAVCAQRSYRALLGSETTAA